ncbi:MAG: nucleotidyltransferase domain-containing protein [Actinomycetota bacterium]|nr:nucleotidyltransferase domain-containing protein [Actinomycetota bacterium]
MPDEEVVLRDAAGCELADNADRFVSVLAAERFLGYLRAQRDAMVGVRGAKTNRPELVAVHGYDTKFATHALRLGMQGVELLATGRMTLPVPAEDREFLRAIRRGEVAEADVLEAIGRAEAELIRLAGASSVPAAPDYAWVDGWLHRAHLSYWGSSLAAGRRIG